MIKARKDICDQETSKSPNKKSERSPSVNYTSESSEKSTRDSDYYNKYISLFDKRTQKRVPPAAIVDEYDAHVLRIEKAEIFEGKILPPFDKLFDEAELQNSEKISEKRLGEIGKVNPKTSSLGKTEHIDFLTVQLDKNTKQYKKTQNTNQQLQQTNEKLQQTNEKLHQKRFRNVFAYGFASGALAIGGILAATKAFVWWKSRK